MPIIKEWVHAEATLEREHLRGGQSMTDQQRINALRKLDAPTKNPPGLRDVKQVELCAKWRKHVTDDAKDIICPNPGGTKPHEIVFQLRADLPK